MLIVDRSQKKITRLLDSLASNVHQKLQSYFISYQQYQNGGIFAVNINADKGFFAQLNWCLYILAHCEKHNLTPYIMLTGQHYRDADKGDNWLGYFFENYQLSDHQKDAINSGKISISSIKSINELRLYDDYHLTLDLALRLFNKYFSLKKTIQDQVDLFDHNNFKHGKVLGIHFRGTDKISEAARIPWENCTDTIKDHLRRNSEIGCLFVASDEAQFVDYIKKSFNSIPVYSHDDYERSTSNIAIHKSTSGNNYNKGVDAIMNCLLLSRCDYLIRTSSFLSAWSIVFNPRLQVTLLNRPYEDKLWFPECEIIKELEKLN